MTHTKEDDTIMMHNIISKLTFNYGAYVENYFSLESLEVA